MNKSYYYLNEARDILGPVSEETLKELQKVGVLGAPPHIREKGTENWLYFSDVFPDLANQSSSALQAVDPAISKSFHYLNKARETQGPVSEENLKELWKAGALGGPPNIWEKGTESWANFNDVFPDLANASLPKPPVARTAQSSPGKSKNLKSALVGCGILAMPAIGILLLKVGQSLADSGSDAADRGSSSTSSNVAPPAAQNLVGRPVTAMNRGVGGGARIKGVIEQEAGDRCKVTITWISEYATGDLAPYGYGHVFQGDSVWTPKRIWSPDY